MKRFFYHGTSADNLESILNNGLSCDESKLWNVSEDAVYLWCPEAVGKAWDCEDEEESNNKAFQMAFESAQFSCAFSKDCRALVLKIELDEDEISPDLSSENMEGQGAVCIYRPIQPKEIKDIKISNDFSLLKGYFLSLARFNEFSNIEVSPIEAAVAEIFQKNSEGLMEEIDAIVEWETVRIKRTNKATA